jgi:tetratricopeptide (TPR) repeat protein
MEQEMQQAGQQHDILPSDRETLDIPTSPKEAARNTFYRIYGNSEQSDLINNILEQLDYHLSSVTLLATAAHHNKWDIDQLVKEWETQRAQHSETFAAAIELSLTSPMFQKLGPDARDLLGVVAFFPQGVDENNIDWLFPTIFNRSSIIDTSCTLSLTSRNHGFITMLAPVRSHLTPKDPKSSPLLCATKERYFSRLSVEIYPDRPGFDEARWITSEDVNIEHMLDIFTSIDANSDEVWAACDHFMDHLFWHKPRLVVFRPKVEGLPDDHPSNSKAKCLSRLAWLFYYIGNFPESKRLHTDALKLWKAQGSDSQVANALWGVSRINLMANSEEEGIRHVEEALEINKRLGDVWAETRSLRQLACLLLSDGKFDDAEKTALQVIDRFQDGGEEFQVCACHRVLGGICDSRGKTEEAIAHAQAALKIASRFNWGDRLFWIYYSLAELFTDKRSFEDAHTHINLARPYAANNVYCRGRVEELQAWVWSREGKSKEADDAALRAAGIYETIGATNDIKRCEAHVLDAVRLLKRRV